MIKNVLVMCHSFQLVNQAPISVKFKFVSLHIRYEAR
jgi:hypothetical protein